MSHDMFNVHLPADLRRAAMDFAMDNAIGLGDVIRMTLARYLSKEGYYRTGGRGWRKGKTTKGSGKSRTTDHAARRMVFSGESEVTGSRPAGAQGGTSSAGGAGG